MAWHGVVWCGIVNLRRDEALCRHENNEHLPKSLGGQSSREYIIIAQ